MESLLLDKKWGILVHLGHNMWGDIGKHFCTEVGFDMDMWNEYVDHCAANGINIIVMDIGEGVQWESHPELSIKGSWSKELVKSEVLRLREKGIELVPKLNFSATHDAWLGIYERMVSTPEYYKVTKELIEEIYEMFLHPSVIHIGMDEENWKHATDDGGSSMVVIRNSALQVHDTNYFIKCVEDLGAKCHMWHDPYCNVKEEDAERIKKSVIPEVWMYYSYLKENWTLIKEQSQEVKDFYATEFVRRYGYTIEYVEESPSVLNAMKLLEKFFEEKRHFFLATSNLYIKNCEKDAIEYVRRNNPDLSLLDGMIGAPWSRMLPDKKEILWEAAELVGKARKIAEEIMQNA